MHFSVITDDAVIMTLTKERISDNGRTEWYKIPLQMNKSYQEETGHLGERRKHRQLTVA